MSDNNRGRSSVSAERNKEIGRRMMEAINKQDLEILDEIMVPEYVNPQLQVQSLEDLKHVLKRQYKGFPDVKRTLLDITGDDDGVWIRVRITGTHTGEYRGFAPTGKKITMDAVPHYRIVHGKIVEGWSVWNPLNLFKQLGVIEYRGFPDEIEQPI